MILAYFLGNSVVSFYFIDFLFLFLEVWNFLIEIKIFLFVRKSKIFDLEWDKEFKNWGGGDICVFGDKFYLFYSFVVGGSKLRV